METLTTKLSAMSLSDPQPKPTPESILIKALMEENKQLKMYIQYLETIISHKEKSIPEWVC